MMHVNQIIMLYTLNLYSTVCQYYLNKAGRKKQKKSLTGNQGKGLLQNKQYAFFSHNKWVYKPFKILLLIISNQE